MIGPHQIAYDDPIVAEANQLWDRLLQEEPPSIPAMLSWQAEHHLVTSGPLCKVLRPGFISTAQRAADQQALELVYAALIRAGARIAAEPAHRERFLGDYCTRFAEYLELDREHSEPYLVVRPDAYPTSTGLVFLELNTSPGGMGQSDMAILLFEQLPIFQRFTRHFKVDRVLTAQVVWNAIRDGYFARGGQGRPTVAALNPGATERTKSREHVMSLVRAGMQAAGMDFCDVPPTELTFEGGQLRHGQTVIDILLRPDLLQMECFGLPALASVLAAVRSGAVYLPSRFGIESHKALLAAITDPACDLGLTAQEQKAVRAHVPWTRVVCEQKTQAPDGTAVELLRWAGEHREDLVLKPTVSFGGKGVVLGWQADQAAWEQALSHALQGRASFIVQARVHPVTAMWPLLAPGFPQARFTADRCPFLVKGRMRGYHTRMSTGSITNLSMGGSTAPNFVIQGRA